MVSPNTPTKYTGSMVHLSGIVIRNRAPTGADIRQPETGKYYPVFTGWQVGKNPTTGTEGDLWLLSKIVANVAYWIQVASEIQSLLTLSDTSNTKVDPLNGNIQLVGGTGVTIDSVPSDNNIVFATTALLNLQPSTGSVTPNEANQLILAGSNNIASSGSGSTITFALTAGVTISSFFAYVNANVTNFTGDGTGSLITCNSTDFNIGTNYSTSTGKYTAPVTGKYLFTACIAISNIGMGHTTGRFFITRKNTGGSTLLSYEMTQLSPAACATTDANLAVTGSTIMQLTATDTVEIDVVVSGSTKTITVNGSSSIASSPYTTFSGQLLP